MKTATRTRVVLRGCLRCDGDLFLEDETYTCIQCGRHAGPVQLMATGRAGSLAETSRPAQRRLSLVPAHKQEEHNDAA